LAGHLSTYGLLPKDFSVIGAARQAWSDEFFREQLGKDLVELGTQSVDPDR
jgi:glucose-6-phosphate 1-dehydrogenase